MCSQFFTNAKVAIIGSGPSGLLLAYLLGLKNFEIEVFESSGEIGGLAKSIKLWGRNVELGPHFINKKDFEKFGMLARLFAENELLLFERNTNVLTRNHKNFSYPPNLSSIFNGLSLDEIYKALVSYAKCKLKLKPRLNNGESTLSFVIGHYLFDYFFRDYIEKLWGRRVSDLDPSFFQALVPFKKKSLLQKLSGLTHHSSQWVYFDGGISCLWNRVYNECMKYDINFFFNSEVTSFTFSDKITVGFNKMESKEYDYVISTLPNSVNRKLFGFPSISNFTFRKLILVYLRLNEFNILSGQCIYLYSERVKAIRITDFSHFPSPHQYENNIILLEYLVEDKDVLWNDDAAILKTVEKDLSLLKLSFKINDFHIKEIRNAYRIPTNGVTSDLQEEASVFRNTNFFPVGRSNSPYFNYGMDTAIQEAIDLANKLAG